MGYSVVPECMTAVKIPGLVHRPLRGGRNRTGIAVIAAAPAPAPAVARFMAMI